MQNQNESGRSMIEMLGVLGIMGVIMYAAVAGINFGIEMYRINATFGEIENLSKNLITMGSFLGNYTKVVGETLLCDNDAFPCTNGNMTNQWGGTVVVAATEDGRSFSITYPNVPQVACQRLLEDMMFKDVRIDSPTSAADCGSSNTMVFSKSNLIN